MSLRPACLVLLLTLPGLLAGCTDDAPAETAAADPLPSLGHYASCPWTRPDGTPYDCAAAGVVLESQAAAPDGWRCVHARADEGWTMYWDPVTGQRGLHLVVPAAVLEEGVTEGKIDPTTTPDVVLYVRHQDQEHVYQLPAAGTAAFVVLPLGFAMATPDPASPTFLDADPIHFRYNTYRLDTIATGNLSGTPEQRWSLWDGQLMLATAYVDGETTHTFADNRVLTNTRRTADGDVELTFVEPQTYFLDGADFGYAQIYTLWHIGRSLGARDTTGLDRACTIAQVAG